MKCKFLFIAVISILFGIYEAKAQDTDAVTEIDSFWIEHNVMSGNVKGMVIHTAFSIENMQGRSISVVAYFLSADGVPIRAPYNAPAQFKTRDGQLCTGAQAYAKYEASSWEDFRLFIPNMLFSSGEYLCVVQISSARGVLLAGTEAESFSVY